MKVLKLLILALAFFCATGCATRYSSEYLVHEDATISTLNGVSTTGPFNSSSHISETKTIDENVDGDEMVDMLAMQFVLGEQSKTTSSTGSGWFGDLGRIVAAVFNWDGLRSIEAPKAIATGGTSNAVSNANNTVVAPTP